MTTLRAQSESPSQSQSKLMHDLWGHPTLDLFHPRPEIPVQKPRLYLAPSTFGESFEQDDLPQVTSAQSLPELSRWVSVFTINLLEIWSGRRQPAQLLSKCHRVIYLELLRGVGCLKSPGRIKSLYITEPLDGACEAAVTIAFGERTRALVTRFEGVDGRWLCTALRLL
jgi:hypothetical protein